MKRFDFSGKHVVLTGAGGLICGHLAQAFADAGAKVSLLDLNRDAVETLATTICHSGGEALAYKVDVLDNDNLNAVCEKMCENFGAIDILVNGAGGNHPLATTGEERCSADLSSEGMSFFDLDKAGIDFVFQLNYLGTLLPIQVFSQRMLSQKGASIINISSMSALTPLTKVPAYSGAKAAVSNLTQWLAVYFSSVDIRCNAIAPGFLLSEQNKTLLYDENGNHTIRANKILEQTPLGRFGHPDELVGAVFFLADSGLSSFVNGVVLPVDGGFSAYSGV